VQAERNIHWQELVLYTILLGNLIVAIYLHFFGIKTYALAFKDVLLLSLFVPILFKKLKFKPFLFLVALFSMFLLYLFLKSEASILARLASARQFVLPFAIVVIASSLFEQIGLKTFLKRSAYLLLMSSIFVYLGLLFEFLPLDNYGSLKQLALTDYKIPYMFYEPLTGNLVRNVSSMLDPINLGHSMVFLLVYGIYEGRFKTGLLILIGLSIVLTMSKGAMLQCALIIPLIERDRFPKWLQYASFLLAAVLIVWVAQWHQGVAAHIHGLKSAIQDISLFGHGLALAGNQGLLFGVASTAEVYDTFLGSLLAQCGIVGLCLWLAPFVWVLFNLKRPIWIKAVLITQLFIALISENSFNFLSVFFLMLALGFFLSREVGHD